MRVPFLNIAADFAAVAADARARIDAVLDSQSFVLAEQTAALESWLAATCGAHAAVACSSGSDALYLAMLALDIGPGDAVAVPSFTFFASAGAIARAGAQPVFVDVEAPGFNSAAGQFREAISREFEPRSGELIHRRSAAVLKALLPVHLFGCPADMVGISAVAGSYGLAIVEDAAQAIGAATDAAVVGNWGRVACFSFYPTKNLGGAGDGGALTTNDEELARRLRRLRVHGVEGGVYEHAEVGINARMGELQAAVLNAKSGLLELWSRKRREIAAAYREGLAQLQDEGLLLLPPQREGEVQVYHQFTLRVPGRRDELQAALAVRGIDSRVFYPLPLHLQPCFAGLGYEEGQLPQAERAAAEVLSLPVYPSLNSDQVAYVCTSIAESLRP